MTNYRLTWMPQVLRDAGLTVAELSGWQSRGHGDISDIRGILLHHTAGPVDGDFPSKGVITTGRTGLAGPLANLGLSRDGTWYTVAAGLAYHAGTGYVDWCGRDNGNQHLIGIEAESAGRGDWTPAQLEAYPRGVAALLRHLGLGVDRAIGHKEWTPRKIDPAGWPGDMNGFRDTTARWLSDQGDDVSYDDAYRAVRDLLNEGFPNPTNTARETTLRTQISHGDWRLDYGLKELTGRLDALSAQIAEINQKLGQGS